MIEPSPYQITIRIRSRCGYTCFARTDNAADYTADYTAHKHKTLFKVYALAEKLFDVESKNLLLKAAMVPTRDF